MSSTDGKVLRWSMSVLLATSSESVNSWFNPVQMARILTCLHGRTVEPMCLQVYQVRCCSEADEKNDIRSGSNATTEDPGGRAMIEDHKFSNDSQIVDFFT